MFLYTFFVSTYGLCMCAKVQRGGLAALLYHSPGGWLCHPFTCLQKGPGPSRWQRGQAKYACIHYNMCGMSAEWILIDFSSVVLKWISWWFDEHWTWLNVLVQRHCWVDDDCQELYLHRGHNGRADWIVLWGRGGDGKEDLSRCSVHFTQRWRR